MAWSKECYKGNKDKVKARYKEWYEKNKHTIIAKRDGEKQAEYARNHYYRHREEILEKRRTNPKVKQYRQEWMIINPTYYRDYRRGNIITTGGKMVKVNKRPRPENDICEVCGNEVIRLEYHHWDDNHPCLGLWLCCGCHRMAERVDKDFHIKYLQEKKGMVLIPPSF